MLEDVRRFSDLRDLLKARRDAETRSLILGGGSQIHRPESGVEQTAFIGLSLEGLGLENIKRQDDGLFIGAMVSLQQLVDSEDVPGYLREAAMFAGSRTLRNMATVGGNIASFRDDSYLVPTLIAAKARIITAEMSDEGDVIEEDVPIREFTDNFEEFRNCLIIGIKLNKKGRCVMTRRFARTVQSRPALTVAFGTDCTSGDFRDVRTAASASGTGIVRLIEVDTGIESNSLTNDEEFLQLVKRIFHPSDDITGTPEYKQYLAAVTLSDMRRHCEEKMRKGACK
jgi:putative selenate reductase FAD-binding subunit